MAEQLFQVGVKALVRDAEGRVLLVCETAHDYSYWDVPGGRMEPGEDLLATLTRELHEEIKVDDIDEARQFMTVLSNKQIQTESGPVALLLIIYEVKLNRGQKPIPGEEGLSLVWHNPREAASLLAEKYPEEFCRTVAVLAT